MTMPGTIYLIDTSAATRMRTTVAVRTTIEKLIDDGIAASCITLDLEAGYSAQSSHDVAQVLASRTEYMINLPVNKVIENRAREVQALMAARGLHRAAGAFDLLTAAVAEHHRAIVLHYDADFEHIASVTGQRQQWIAPRGSVD